MRELISPEAIAGRVQQLGAQIRADYAASRDLVLLIVLKGGFIFAADLARAIDLRLRLEFVIASSYRGVDGGELHIGATSLPVAGADVVIVEDIIERGVTLEAITAMVRACGAASVSICALLRKPMAPATLPVRYVGFEIGPAFVIGYGLDHDECHRNLPGVAVLG